MIGTTFFKRAIPLTIVFALLVFLMPRSSKFPYDYTRGREWKHETLFADFDFPIYKTEEELRNERSNTENGIIPYYKYSEETANRNVRAAEAMTSLGTLRKAVSACIENIYSKGVISDEQQEDASSVSEVIYIQKNKRAFKSPLSEVYSQTDARDKLLDSVRKLTDLNADSLLRAEGVYDLIIPNVIYDEQTTDLVNAERESDVSPTSGYVTSGQLIVSEGEIVTAEVEQMLDSYKIEFEQNVGNITSPVLSALGGVLVSASIVALLYLLICLGCPHILEDTRYPYVITVFAIFSVLSLIIIKADASLLYAVPFTLAALMLQAFMRSREIIPVYIALLVPMLLFSYDGPELFVMFLVAGLVDMHIFHNFQRGWKQFIAALIVFAVLSVIYLSFRAADLIAGSVWRPVLSLFIGSMLSVAGYPLIYLFERLFNLVSSSRLIELCDTSNPLIRSLEQKAPGTFQHSLQVMNMADTVARAVDVNPDLVRAGALYHDIGKINNPLCFVENEFLVTGDDSRKYHTGLTPMQSAHDIKRHVSDGVEIAQKNRLPKVITDFINTHHGTTVVRFFYSKFLKEGGDESQIGEFCYDGEKPKTKAQIILMLCDSIEAASRTLKSNTPETYSDFVEGIVAGKMEEHQFDNADVSISELNTIKETLKQYLAQLNHERVVYPKNKLKKQQI